MSRSKQSAEFLAGRSIHEEWESDYLNADLDAFYDAAFAKLIMRLGAKPGDKILDAGCGYCFHATRLARAGLLVTAVDLSPAALEEARRILEGQKLSIDLRQGDLLSLPFHDESFQFVNCWGVLMHIREVEKALEELARVLECGGRLAIMENNRRSFHVRIWELAIRTTKRIVGRKVPRRDSTPRGVEEWREEGLLIRKLDIDWLIDFYAQRGLNLVDRFAGQFTEAYTNLPTKTLKKFVYRFNERWFRSEWPPGLALANILIFEKNA